MFSNVNDQKKLVDSQEIIKRISTKVFGHFSELTSEDTHSKIMMDDSLSELKSNIAELEDVSNRLRFMMREVSYLIRKN